jgi:PAS domain S-box-containing protein
MGLWTALLALILFAGYLYLHSSALPNGSTGPGLFSVFPFEHLVVAGLLGGLLAYDIFRRTRRRYSQVLEEIEKRTASLRDPQSGVPLSREARANLDPAALGVASQLEALAGAYHKVAAELVLANDQLEQLREQNPSDPARTGPLSNVQSQGASRKRMVARLAPNLHWIAATPALQRFVGCPVTELVARSFLDIVYPKDAPGLSQRLQEVLKDGEGHNITFRVLVPPQADFLTELPDVTREDSSSVELGTTAGDSSFISKPPPSSDQRTKAAVLVQRYLQMDVMTCYSNNDVPMHLRCHLLDVTDRIATEKELRRRTRELANANARLRQSNADLQRLKESYRDLYHQAPALYFSLDEAGHFAAFNDTMLRTLGYEREELMGQPYTRVLTPSSRATFLADPVRMQRPGEVESQWIQRDGTVIDVWIATTIIKDERGVFVRSRSAASDVTERNRLANTLRAQAQAIEQANMELRLINQELKEFTYVVSHDLKEPLRTLESFSNFLAQDYGTVLGPEGNDYLNHLIQASRRLGCLIDDLLTLSRVGRVIKTPHRFAWDEVLRTVLGDLQDLIQRKQAVVRVEGPLPAVEGDPDRIIQLLSNLVTNGLRYNTSRDPEVVIGTPAVSPADTSGQFVTLFVRDNGIGIEPQYHDQIFLVFRRLHRREEFEGTGAGLAICKRIVEAHGGRIWVESDAGHGASFLFTLPRLREVEPKPGPNGDGKARPGTSGTDEGEPGPSGTEEGDPAA